MASKPDKPKLPRLCLTYEQKLAIARWILEEKNILFGALSGTVTNLLKTTTWQKIFDKCIANGFPVYDVNQIRGVRIYD